MIELARSTQTPMNAEPGPRLSLPRAIHRARRNEMTNVRFIRTVEVWEYAVEEGETRTDIEVLVAVEPGSVIRKGEVVYIPDVGRAKVLDRLRKRDVGPDSLEDRLSPESDPEGVLVRLRVDPAI
jgi:hypothetical protein